MHAPLCCCCAQEEGRISKNFHTPQPRNKPPTRTHGCPALHLGKLLPCFYELRFFFKGALMLLRLSLKTDIQQPSPSGRGGCGHLSLTSTVSQRCSEDPKAFPPPDGWGTSPRWSGSLGRPFKSQGSCWTLVHTALSPRLWRKLCPLVLLLFPPTTKTTKIYFVFNNRFQRVTTQAQYFIGSEFPNTVKTSFQVSSVRWELTKDKIGALKHEPVLWTCMKC